MTAAGTPAVVVTTTTDPFLHGMLGIVRTLGRLGAPCHVVYDGRRPPVTRSRYVASSVRLPYDDRGAERYLHHLLELGDRVGRAVLVPVDDRAALFVAEHGDAWGSTFLVRGPSATVSRTLADKRALYRLCREHGVDAPASVFPSTREEAAAAVRELGLPVVVKGYDPVRLRADSGRARSVVVAATLPEALEAWDALDGPAGSNAMLQEYIPGGADSIWMFNGYFDARSRCLAGYTGTKLRQCLPDTGPTSLGVCVRNPEVAAAAERLLSRLDYQGVVDLGFRYDARDGRYKLLDVNPRVGGTFRLFAGADGMDVVRALYLDLTERPVTADPAPDGRRWVVEPNDLRAGLLYHRQGRLAWADWARSYRGVREAAWWARDDPRPFTAMCGEVVGAVVRARARATPAAEDRPGPAPGPQQPVTGYFQRQAAFWADVYRRDDVFGRIHQRRRQRALALIDRLRLAPGSRVLEVGCGAGLLTVALAERKCRVTALDSAQAMLDQARGRLEAAGLGHRVDTQLGDVHALDLGDACCDLVVALGVLPWLHSPARAVREMGRVLRPGGHVVLNIDNRYRLSAWVDPMANPSLRPLRSAGREALASVGLARRRRGAPRVTMHRSAELTRMLRATGLVPVAHEAYGYGPFTMLGRPVLSDGFGVRVDAALQAAADRGSSVLRATAAQQLVLARKAEP